MIPLGFSHGAYKDNISRVAEPHSFILLQKRMKNRLRWLDIITAPIARNPEFLVFMFALGITAALLSVDYAHKAKLYEYAWEELFFCLYVVCAVLAVLPQRLRAVARGLVYAVAYPVTIVDMYCFVKFDTTLNPSILMLVNETDPREAGEFFSAYLSPDVLMTNVGWVLLIPILHILWSIHRKLRKPSRLIALESKAADGIKRVRPLWNVLVAVCVIVSGIHCFPNLRNLQSLMSQKTVGGIEHRLTEKDCGKQYLPLYRFSFSVYANYLASKQIDIIKRCGKNRHRRQLRLHFAEHCADYRRGILQAPFRTLRLSSAHNATPGGYGKEG